MRNFDFSKYCTPSQLYLILGAIGIIMGFLKNYGVWTLLTEALFLVIWAWVLNWLCSKGFKTISWILVLLPFIMAFITYFLVKDVAVKEGLTASGTQPRPSRPSAISNWFNRPKPPAPAPGAAPAATPAAPAPAAPATPAPAPPAQTRAGCRAACNGDPDPDTCKMAC